MGKSDITTFAHLQGPATLDELIQAAQKPPQFLYEGNEPFDRGRLLMLVVRWQERSYRLFYVRPNAHSELWVLLDYAPVVLGT